MRSCAMHRRVASLGFSSALALALAACGEQAPPPTPTDAARRDAASVTDDAFVVSIDAPIAGDDAFVLPSADAHVASGDAGSLDGGSFDVGSRDAHAPLDASASTDAFVAPADAPSVDAGRDAVVTTCTGLPPFAGDGRAESLFGTARWSVQFSGNFVSLSGDTAVVGNEGVWGTSAGYVRVFTWDGCTNAWSMEAELVGARTTDEDVFGSAVALDGDTLAVGANMRPDSSNTGAVHVFTRSGTTWTEAPMPIYPPTSTGGRFGRALGLSGNVLAIGAPFGKDPSSAITYTGIVAIYTRGPMGRFTMADLVLGSGAARDDAFGYALSLDADTMVVGGPGAFNWSVVPARAGKAWIFTGSGGTWTEAAALTASDGANGDWFGRSVARAGDVVLVGAPRHDVTTSGGDVLSDAGSVYVFTRSGTTWTETARLSASDASADAYFGFTVGAISRDRVVVGAAGVGRLYTFVRSGGAWTQESVVHTACSGDIGWALDVDGALAISGRPTGVVDLASGDGTCVP